MIIEVRTRDTSATPSRGNERIGVIGAGIIGLAVARRLGQLQPDAVVTILEKEREVATHQSGRNSGVVHSGLYYAPGSLKATLCRKGAQLLREYCEERGLPYVECGKLVVAVDPSELERLAELERRGRANGVPGLRRVDREEIKEIEPHVSGVAGLHSPSTAITDYSAIAKALLADIRSSGGTVIFEAPVTDIRVVGSRARVSSGGADFEFDRLVICAGLQSDRIARIAGDVPEPTIIPFRGEYYRVIPARQDLVRGLVYPVPDPTYPFLGIHFTRGIDGSVEVGPNAVLALAREGYRRRDVNLADTLETLRSRGFRALARQHWQTGAREAMGSLFRAVFAGAARRYVPELRNSDLRRGRAGVRAQAIDPDGSLVDDFRIGRVGPVCAVRNAPSPGATSSLAIAEHVADVVVAS
jgi:L-2-hydroxyglutarate oxidase LhgO